MAWHVPGEFGLEGLPPWALGMVEQCWGENPDDLRVVYTNFQGDFLSGFALIKQGEDVILSLLGDGLHDEMAEAGGVLGLYLEPNWVWYD